MVVASIRILETPRLKVNPSTFRLRAAFTVAMASAPMRVSTKEHPHSPNGSFTRNFEPHAIQIHVGTRGENQVAGGGLERHPFGQLHFPGAHHDQPGGILELVGPKEVALHGQAFPGAQDKGFARGPGEIRSQCEELCFPPRDSCPLKSRRSGDRLIALQFAIQGSNLLVERIRQNFPCLQGGEPTRVGGSQLVIPQQPIDRLRLGE